MNTMSNWQKENFKNILLRNYSSRNFLLKELKQIMLFPPSNSKSSPHTSFGNSKALKNFQRKKKDKIKRIKNQGQLQVLHKARLSWSYQSKNNQKKEENKKT